MFDTIRGWLIGRPTYHFDFAQAKRRCRILVIDDDANALPLAEVTSDEYNVKQEKIVDADLLRQCETALYDIILLDYNGVAPPAITPDDGFGIFARIRTANPAQYIIAISGQTYDISKTEYFRRANDWLGKPTDLATTKNKLDTGIRYLFDKSAVLKRLKSSLLTEGFRQNSVDRVIGQLAAKNFSNFDEMSEIVKRVAKVTELSSHIVGILKALAKLGIP